MTVAADSASIHTPELRWGRIVLTAFALEFVLCSIPPNSIAAAMAGYGPVRFWVFNGLRLIGCVLGTVYAPRRG